MRALIDRASLTDWLLLALLIVNVVGFCALLYRLEGRFAIHEPISVIIDKPL